VASGVLAIVLAAGEGRRMGGPKALVEIAGSTFLSRVVETLRRPGVSEVVVVVGHEAERVMEAHPTIPAAVWITNARYREGMLSSVWLGLDSAERLGAGAVLLHPVDHPLVAPETVDRVLDALSGGARIAVPSHAGRRGHPGGFARAAWPALRAASPASGARAVLADHPEWIVHVPGDPGCLAGIDTPDDYERLLGPRP
jgi:CTP:molybdopterin cytidylyltransferase MocA